MYSSRWHSSSTTIDVRTSSSTSSSSTSSNTASSCLLQHLFRIFRIAQILQYLIWYGNAILYSYYNKLWYSGINKGTRKETIHFLHTYHHWTMREILAWVCLVWICLVSAGIFPLHLLRHFVRFIWWFHFHYYINY